MLRRIAEAMGRCLDLFLDRTDPAPDNDSGGSQSAGKGKAMASFERPRLDIERGDSTSRVTVRLGIRFNSIDVLGNLRYRATVQLFGQDLPPEPGGDDPLFTFPPVTVRPNGQTTQDRIIVAQVANSILDEDRGPDEDEIYARVCLRSLDAPFPTLCRPSNVVVGEFSAFN